jgi:non-ribosomal peptide synthetase component F
MCENPDFILAQCSLLTEQEKEQLLQCNDTGFEYPADHSVSRLFEHQVQMQGDALAAQFMAQGDLGITSTSVTYRELNQRANRLAHLLQAQGVGTDTLVGIGCPRGLELLVALLAIMKAGAAYVPLDPEFPGERLQHMVTDSGLTVLLTLSSVAETFNGFVSDSVTDPDLAFDKPVLLCLDQLGEQLAQYPDHNPVSEANYNPGQLAYVIYTSGSTGLPKGVMVSQRNLVNFLSTMQQVPGIQSTDKVLNLTSLSFDISGLELYLPLISGAVVCT